MTLFSVATTKRHQTQGNCRQLSGGGWGGGGGKPNPLMIKGREVEVVHQYIYLGTILDDRQDHSANTRSLLKKGNQRIHFVKKLISFTSVQSYWNCSTEPLWSPLSPSTVLASLAARRSTTWLDNTIQ